MPTRVGRGRRRRELKNFARWTDGRLHKLNPDHVRDKRSSPDDAIRVSVLSKALGRVPLSAFTLEHAERAMRQLDELRQARERERATTKGRKVRTLKPLSRSSRRQPVEKSVDEPNGFSATRQLVAELVAASLARVRRGGVSAGNRLVGRAGLEPATYGLKVRSSTD